MALQKENGLLALKAPCSAFSLHFILALQLYRVAEAYR